MRQIIARRRFLDRDTGSEHQFWNTPPVPCEFQLGDIVTFTNCNGVVFPGNVIVGFTRTADDSDRFIYLNFSGWWCPVRPCRLRLEQHVC